jgi:hypothetical protein
LKGDTDVCKAIIKTCKGDKTCWNQVAHSVFWAERVTVQKSMGLSPYFMMHGVEPIFPFDLAEVTFLTPLEHQGALMTTELIAGSIALIDLHCVCMSLGQSHQSMGT